MALLTESAVYNILGLIGITFTFFYLFVKYKYTHWKKLGVPFVEPKFPFGNFKDSVQLRKALGEIMEKFYYDAKLKNQKYVGLFFFYNPSLMIVDPDLIKSVMSRDFAHFYDRGSFHDEENDPLTAHLFSLEGQKWKNLRAKLTPTFTSGKMKKMFQTLVDASLELRDCLDEKISKGEPCDIKQISGQYTTDVIGSCAFGIDCNSFKDPNTQFVKIGRKIFNPNFFDRIRMFAAVLFPSVFKAFKLRQTNSEVDSFYRNLVKDTVEYREKNNITRNDFMHLLIQLKNKGTVEIDEHDDEIENDDQKHIDYKLTMNGLSAQAFIFFLAGFETSSTTITWALYELSKYTTVQDKLREEILQVLKKYDNKITYDSITEMHYLDRVIKETLRKFSPLPLLQRVVTQEYTIPDTDVKLKKGTPIFIPISCIQNDPEYHPDPEIFDPDRFTEEAKASRPDYTWLPFGEGPRICIGLRFGMMQVKVGLCQLLLNYKFTLNPKTAYPPILDPNSFILSTKDTIWLDAQRVSS